MTEIDEFNKDCGERELKCKGMELNNFIFITGYDCQRIDAFELWCWRRLLWVPWTARRSNHSILKEISPGCSLEGLMLKLKLQYFGHLMQRVDSLEKTLMLEGTGGRRRGWHRMRWLDSITDLMHMSLGELQELVMDREAWVLLFMGLQRVRHDWVTELNWTESINNHPFSSLQPSFLLYQSDYLLHNIYYYLKLFCYKYLFSCLISTSTFSM